MKTLELERIINGTLINGINKNKKIGDICINSREMKKNDCFIALVGANNDGHQFIDEVLSKASMIIVSKDVNIQTDIPIIKVGNTYDALLQIASYYRSKFNGKIVAITGSSGKTMTKELIYNILSKKYKVLKSMGNHNNHIGLPLTLTKLNNKYDIAVIEMGMNHLKEISFLSKISKPDIAVITNIGSAHIGNLRGKKNIFKAKCEILDGMKQGYLVINDNDKYLKKIRSKKVNIIKNNIQLTKINTMIDKTIFNIRKKQEYEFTLNMPGSHLVSNCLLAIKVGLLFSIPFDDMIKSIENYKTLNNRLNIIKLNDNILIDDCYNSNYESVMGIIDYLKQIKKKSIIVLGDILELGKYSKKIHKKIGKRLRKEKINSLFVGKYMYYAYKKCGGNYFKDKQNLIEYLQNNHFNNSVIVFKASRGIHLEDVIKEIV